MHLFRRESAELMLGHFTEILEQVTVNRKLRLSEIKITVELESAVFEEADSELVFGF